MKKFYRLIYKISTAFFGKYYHYQVFGLQNIPPEMFNRGLILASNHNSYFDPPLLGAAWPEELHYLAAEKLFKIPIFGFIIKRLNAHPIAGKLQDIHSFKMMSKLIQDNKKIVIFPEGGISKNGQLKPFKLGVAMLALRARCPIIPVYIHGSFEAWPGHKKHPTFPGKISCVFGSPIFIEPYLSLEKKQAYATLTKKLKEEIENLRLWLENQN